MASRAIGVVMRGRQMQSLARGWRTWVGYLHGEINATNLVKAQSRSLTRCIVAMTHKALASAFRALSQAAHRSLLRDTHSGSCFTISEQHKVKPVGMMCSGGVTKLY